MGDCGSYNASVCVEYSLRKKKKILKKIVKKL